jgi:hypothetical protein
VCDLCTAGYVCTGGTITATPTNSTGDGGYICPAGSYCPLGSSVEIPCPAGRYNTETGGTALSACVLCQDNSFQPLTGQQGCRPCGSSSYSLAGADLCSCNGTNRAFQPSDGSCICAPRYEYYDENLVLSDADSIKDCQPKIYDRCTGSTSRNFRGLCVDNSANAQCVASCPSGTGTFKASLGICECSDNVDENEVCDALCRQNQLRLYIDSNGALTVTNPALVGNQTVSAFSATSVPGLVGTISCLAGSQCRLLTMRTTAEGFLGMYDLSTSFYNSLLGSGNSTTAARRRILSTASSGVLSPIVCMQAGDGMLWDLSGASRTHYPVYLKDSLFNTNPSFDYGQFRELAYKMASNLTVSSFGFVFNDPGVYAFGDNANLDRMTVITVLRSTEVCPKGTAQIVPLTSQNLVGVGVVKTSQITLTPDWALIAVLLLGLVLLIGGVIGGMSAFG